MNVLEGVGLRTISLGERAFGLSRQRQSILGHVLVPQFTLRRREFTLAPTHIERTVDASNATLMGDTEVTATRGLLHLHGWTLIAPFVLTSHEVTSQTDVG